VTSFCAFVFFFFFYSRCPAQLHDHVFETIASFRDLKPPVHAGDFIDSPEENGEGDTMKNKTGTQFPESPSETK
jgi:hypothetical protein